MPTFDSTVVEAVLAHMNGDHPEDNLLIAHAFGHPDALTATMIGLDENGGFWAYTVAGKPHEVTVPWTAPITERREIRREVVVIYDSACAKLGLTPREHE